MEQTKPDGIASTSSLNRQLQNHPSSEQRSPLSQVAFDDDVASRGSSVSASLLDEYQSVLQYAVVLPTLNSNIAQRNLGNQLPISNDTPPKPRKKEPNRDNIEFIKERNARLKYDHNNFRTASSSGVQSEQIYPSDSNESSGFQQENVQNRLLTMPKKQALPFQQLIPSSLQSPCISPDYKLTDPLASSAMTANAAQNAATAAHIYTSYASDNNNNQLHRPPSSHDQSSQQQQQKNNLHHHRHQQPQNLTTANNKQPENSHNAYQNLTHTFDNLTNQLKHVLDQTITQKLDQENTKFQLNMSKQRQEFSLEMHAILEALKNAETQINTLTSALNNKDKLVEQMVQKMQQQKKDFTARKMLMKWKDIHRERKMQRLLEKTADEHYKRKLLSRTIYSWKTGTSSQWKDRLSTTCQDKAENICQILSSRHQLEIQRLEAKVLKLQEENINLVKSKDSFQTDMKDAFMRGVCALNIEAMRVLSPGSSKVGSENSISTERIHLDDRTEKIAQEVAIGSSIPKSVNLVGKTGSSSSSKKHSDKIPFPSSGLPKRLTTIPLKTTKISPKNTHKPSYLSTFNEISPRSDQYEKTVQNYLQNRPDNKNLKKFMVEHHHQRHHTDNSSNSTSKSAASAMLLASDVNCIRSKERKEQRNNKHRSMERKVIGGKSSVASDYS